MRNVIKVVSSVGAAALLLSGAVTAAPPQAFGTWAVNSTGVISGAGCTGGVVGTGFLQCQVVIGTGSAAKTYIQTIIAEGFAAPVPTTGSPLDRLTFRSQDFVQIGQGSSQGVASTVGIKDSVTNPGTTFGTTADIMAGWATGNTDKSSATLTLSVVAPATVTAGVTANNGFASTFDITAVTNSADQNVISTLGLGQTVALGGTGTDRQRFEMRVEPAAPAITAYTIGGITANPLGGVLTAAAGNSLRGHSIAQTVGADKFATQALSVVDSLGNATSTTSLTSLGSTATVEWSTAGQVFFDQFGAIPAF